MDEVELRITQMQLAAAQRELEWTRSRANKAWVIGFLTGIVFTTAVVTAYGWYGLLG